MKNIAVNTEMGLKIRRLAGRRGFTLLELIIVISIIGVLVAVALPRMIEVHREARVTKMNSIFSLVRSASALGHSRCRLDLLKLAPSETAVDCSSAPPMVNMDGVMVRISNRYPAASADGIDTAAGFDKVSDGLAGSNSSVGGVPTRFFDLV